MSTPNSPSERPSGRPTRRSRKRVAGLLLAGITGLHTLGAGTVDADMAAEVPTVATVDCRSGETRAAAAPFYPLKTGLVRMFRQRSGLKSASAA